MAGIGVRDTKKNRVFFSLFLGHLVGREQVGDGKVISEFWKKAKKLEYKSGTQVEAKGKLFPLFGFKIAREQGMDKNE